MKKTCKNCNMVFDVTSNENHCPECGGVLISDTIQVGSNMPQRSNLQMDNRIHKGDNIGELHNGNEMHVGGDSAENIDKSTTINNNTTTNNTTYVYQQPEDKGREMVICEYSGANVYLNDTFICKTCNRRIDKKFYIDKYNCCKECSEKKETGQKDLQKVEVSAVSNNRQADVTPATSTHNLHVKKEIGVTINVNPDISDIPYNDMSRMRHETKHNRNVYLYALIAVILIVGSIWYLGSQSKDKDSSNLTERTEQHPTSKVIANEDEKSGTAAKASVTHNNAQTELSASSQTVQSKETAAVESAAVNNAPVLSPMEEGEAAYKSGNYSKAKIFLDQASGEGNATASYYLALMYGGGKGVSVDLQKSFTYMRKAAEGGETRAFFPLAEMYRNGDGTEANRAQAKKWYEKTILSDSDHAEKASEILEFYE